MPRADTKALRADRINATPSKLQPRSPCGPSACETPAWPSFPLNCIQGLIWFQDSSTLRFAPLLLTRRFPFLPMSEQAPGRPVQPERSADAWRLSGPEPRGLRQRQPRVPVLAQLVALLAPATSRRIPATDVLQHGGSVPGAGTMHPAAPATAVHGVPQRPPQRLPDTPATPAGGKGVPTQRRSQQRSSPIPYSSATSATRWHVTDGWLQP